MPVEPAIGILGSAGRMGRAIAELIPEMGTRLAGGTDVGDDRAALAREAGAAVVALLERAP